MFFYLLQCASIVFTKKVIEVVKLLSFVVIMLSTLWVYFYFETFTGNTVAQHNVNKAILLILYILAY